MLDGLRGIFLNALDGTKSSNVLIHEWNDEIDRIQKIYDTLTSKIEQLNSAYWIIKKGVLHPLETDGICSNCNYTTSFYDYYNYCPKCGFKMTNINS